MDDGRKAPVPFKAPQPQLFSIIIQGILGGNLEWALVIAGALIAVTLELMGVSALPVAVGMYLGLGTATPIFFGGILRWLTDRMRGVSASEAESETSPGVLLSSGYIAGGTLCGLLYGFLVMGLPASVIDALGLGESQFGKDYLESPTAKLTAVLMFALLAVILFNVGSRKTPVDNGEGATSSG
jgi:hypothetical protein